MAYVYLLASGRNGTLYIGVTRDLIKRVYEHKSTFVPGFTSRYQINQLVWFQQSDAIESAIVREKQMKAWRRAWKIALIERSNPYWHDLYEALLYMIILGIDPGLRVTGFGVIRKDGHKLTYIASGTIRIPDGDLPSRLKVILNGVGEVIRAYQPGCAAIEKVFANVNPQSTLLLGQARGAAICGLVAADLDVYEYTALQVKKAVVGQGKAQKAQVQDMVQRLLLLKGLPGTDAADALGVAICHAHSGAALAALATFAPTMGLKGLRVKGGRLIA
jgi:crossover junction endodeoxyribonuclease RuvC